MTHRIFTLTRLTLGLLLVQTLAFAQPEKEKTTEKKEIMDQADELIISRKNAKDSRVTVEIKDGQVTVNGKAVDSFNDENLSIRVRGRRPFADDDMVTIHGGGSPFRVESWGSGDKDVWVNGYDSKRALLGVSSDKAEGGGAVVSQVTKGSAAEKIGLKKGDIITRIDDAVIDDGEDLVNVIRKHKPEDKVVVTYKRAGKEEKATATLGKYKMDYESYGALNVPDYKYDYKFAMPPTPRIKGIIAPHPYVWNMRGPRIGIKAQDTEEGKGAKVLDVDDESPAAKAGIKEGDIITQFDGKAVNSANDLSEAARSAQSKSTFKVKLTRAGKIQELQVKIPRKLNTADL